MDDEGLFALLFAQLTWPSVLVRERACVEIARLFADPLYATQIGGHLLRWLRAQELESVAALGLLALLRAQIEIAREPIPNDSIAAAISRPSILSSMLLGEYSPGQPFFDASTSHSGVAPADFSAEPFFAKHIEAYLPPIYNFWAGEIEEMTRIPFRRQWAYEWSLAKARVGTEASVAPLRFWLSGIPYKDRYQGADMPLSEVYRSAYLRSLGWALDIEALSRRDADFFAATTCPIDLELWRLRPGRRPPWWPQIEEPAGKVDTAAVAIWRCVEDLWRAHADGNPPWNAGWALAEASGRVHTGTTTYELEIFGFYQKCHGPAAPDLAKLTTWYLWDPENRIDVRCSSSVRLCGEARNVPLNARIQRSGDWTLVPAAGPVERADCTPRWQWWRMDRKVWMPTPCHEGSRFELGFEDGSMATRINGRFAARWSDWTIALAETLPEGLPPATGQCLLVDRSLVRDFAASTASAFCWVCRLTGYFRGDSTKAHEKFSDHRSFGARGIIVP